MRKLEFGQIKQKIFRRLNRIFNFVSGGSDLISLKSSVIQFSDHEFLVEKPQSNKGRKFIDLDNPVVFKDVIVSTVSGNVFKIVDGISYYISESDFRHPYQALWSRERPKRVPRKKIDERCVVVPKRSGNYFHFFVEDLPDLLLELREKPDRVIASSELPKFARDLLDHNFKVDYIVESEIYARRLIKTPKVQRFQDIVDKNRLHRVREFLKLPGAGTQNRRIFILRDKNDPFEASVAQVFKSMDFRIETLVDMPILEQIDLFASVQIIAGFAGAGLTNLFFANNPSRVTLIELCSMKSKNQYWRKSVAGECWQPFSMQLGSNYAFLELNHLENPTKSIDRVLKEIK